MPTREGALSRAAMLFDSGAFRERLAGLVAIRSTSQDPAFAGELDRYLQVGLAPWLRTLGFAVTIHPNPQPGCGPILTATRVEDPALPCVLLYGQSKRIPSGRPAIVARA